MSRPPAGDPQRVPGPRARRLDGGTRRLIAIVGPTGTGKSAVAAGVAERIGGEVVGCDALQVYRGLEAATAKPSADERRRAPHHLIDIAEPRENFTLADYVRAADGTIAEILARGRVPVVAGGTGMYLRGLLKGIVPLPKPDALLRDRLRRLAERFGTPRLHRWLLRLDPASAARLHRGDTQRVLRAIEIALAGGPSWSERLERVGTWAGVAERYAALKFGLDMDRAQLDRRLDRRVAGFFAAGLVDEVRSLLHAGVPPEANAFKAIGYREVLDAIRSGAEPEHAIVDVQRNTRRYARRQRTWFRREPNVTWLDVAAGSRAIEEQIVAAYLEKPT